MPRTFRQLAAASAFVFAMALAPSALAESPPAEREHFKDVREACTPDKETMSTTFLMFMSELYQDEPRAKEYCAVCVPYLEWWQEQNKAKAAGAEKEKPTSRVGAAAKESVGMHYNFMKTQCKNNGHDVPASFDASLLEPAE